MVKDIKALSEGCEGVSYIEKRKLDLVSDIIVCLADCSVDELERMREELKKLSGYRKLGNQAKMFAEFCFDSMIQKKKAGV